MQHHSRKSETVFIYKNPSDHSDFDGTPYEAAEKAVDQASAVYNLLIVALKDVDVQARNVLMERNLRDTGSPDAEEYNGTPEHAALIRIAKELNEVKKKLEALKLAVSYKPSPRGKKKQ